MNLCIVIHVGVCVAVVVVVAITVPLVIVNNNGKRSNPVLKHYIS